MFKEGEYITIIGSYEKIKKGECRNWDCGTIGVDRMDKFTNKVVQLTHDTSPGGSYAQFEGSLGYSWNYNEGHFRRATPEEIAAGCLVETPIVVNDYEIF